jgi:hypothetical protein
MEQLLGPLAALALALLILGLFYKGMILPRNTVRREDFEALQKVNADYAEGLKTLTKSVEDLIVTVKLIQENNGRR